MDQKVSRALKCESVRVWKESRVALLELVWKVLQVVQWEQKKLGSERPQVLLQRQWLLQQIVSQLGRSQPQWFHCFSKQGSLPHLQVALGLWKVDQKPVLLCRMFAMEGCEGNLLARIQFLLLHRH